MLLRFLVLLVVVLAAVWWIRAALARSGRRADDAPRARRQPAAPERMLECTHCGILVPESEGVREAERFYCCADHRRAGPRAH